MKENNNQDKLAKAIISVMKEVTGMEKNSKVGSGKSQYDGTKDSDVKEVFNEAMAKNGLCILPIDIEESTKIDRWQEEQFWNGQSQGIKTKQSVFTKVTTKYLLLHESGQSQILSGYGHGVDPQDKGAGKATTYALKNCLLYTFLTPVGKIDDTDPQHSNDIPVPPQQQSQQPKKEEPKKSTGTGKKPLTDARYKKALKDASVEDLTKTLAIFQLTPNQIKGVTERITQLKNK